MRNRLFLICLASLFLTTAWSAELRIRIVDLSKVFNEFYKTKLADAQLKEQIAEMRDERKELYDSFVALQQEFNELREQSTDAGLSEEERGKLTTDAAERLKLIREQENKIRRMDEIRRKQIEEQGRRMRKRIVDEIRETVVSYATSQGLDAVLDSSGQSLNGVDVVLFADSRVDVTDSIIELLNKNQAR